MTEKYPGQVVDSTIIERVDNLWLVGQEKLVTDGQKIFRCVPDIKPMNLMAVRLNPVLGQDDMVHMYLFFSYVRQPFNSGIWVKAQSLFTEGELLAIESELYLLWQGLHANNQNGKKMSWIMPVTFDFERSIFRKTHITIQEKIKQICNL